VSKKELNITAGLVCNLPHFWGNSGPEGQASQQESRWPQRPWFWSTSFSQEILTLSKESMEALLIPYCVTIVTTCHYLERI